ncbi:MAG: DNRLRE domain-containing protein [Bacteroidota bacterium]
MKALNIIITCIYLFLVTNSYSQTTKTFYTQKDASISTSTPDSNNGNSTTFYSYLFEGKIGVMQRSLIEVDLSSIPQGSTILNATLKLSGVNHLGGNESYLSAITDIWDENTVTWNNQPTYDKYMSVYLPNSTYPTEDYSVDITTICQSWTDGTVANNGLILRIGPVLFLGTNQLSFASSDYADSTKWPYLEVTYELPTTKLINSDCGATDVEFDQILTAKEITGVDYYEFLVENSNIAYSESIVKNVNTFTLNEFAGIEYNISYDIAVRSILGSDTSDWGDMCQIVTEPLLTQLSDEFCGKANIKQDDILFAKIINSADNYEFLIENSFSGYSYLYTSTDGSLPLNQISGLEIMKIYSVQIKFHSSSNWSDFGEKCIFSLQPGENVYDKAPMEVRDKKLYSNKFLIRFLIPDIINISTNEKKVVGTDNINDQEVKNIIYNYSVNSNINPTKIIFKKVEIDKYLPQQNMKNIFEIWFPKEINIDEITEELENIASVDLIQKPNSILELSGIDYTDIGLLSNPFRNWNIEQVQAPNSWVFLQGLPDITVGIIEFEGRADPYHPELLGRISNYNSSGITDYDPNDLIEIHATMVAGIIASKPNTNNFYINQGSTYEAGTISISNGKTKVASHSSYPYSNTDIATNEFIAAQTEPGNIPPKVLSLSYCDVDIYTYPEIVFTPPQNLQIDIPLYENLMQTYNTTIFAGSGNNRDMHIFGANKTGNLRGIGYPFGIDGVIGVGASAPSPSSSNDHGMGGGPIPGNQYNAGEGWNYNYNDIGKDYDNDGFLDIVAPGKYFDTPYTIFYNNQIGILQNSGTSLSTPLVATIGACMFNVNPLLTSNNVKDILLETSDKVFYNPNGLLKSELESTVSYTKGYRYNNGDDFSDSDMDWIMGYGRVNMLSAMMNAAGKKSGGYTINTSLPYHHIEVKNINDHSYLYPLGIDNYNDKYEYDAILNQENVNITFDGIGSIFELAANSTFRIASTATLGIINQADLIINDGMGNEMTKLVVEDNGYLILGQNNFSFTDKSLLLIQDNGNLIIQSGSVLIIESGASLKISSGSVLKIEGNGKLLIENGGYLCIENGVTIELGNLSTIELEPNSYSTGINPLYQNAPYNCAYPCSNCKCPFDYIPSGNPGILIVPYNQLSSNIQINNNAGCDCSGNATGIIIDGLSPFEYQWNDAGSQTTSTATSLCQGDIYLTVTDAANCMNVSSGTISGGLLNLTETHTDVLCNGNSDGTATVNTTGGILPYTYLWNDPGNQTSQTAIGLIPGVYNVIVTDNNSDCGSINITIEEPALINIDITMIEPNCNGGNDGSLFANVIGGVAPYNYLWDDPSSQTTENATNLLAGIYNVIVTDNNLCTSQSSAILNEPSLIIIAFDIIDATCEGIDDGFVTANVSGGTSPYNYNWDAQFLNNYIFDVEDGFYNVTITDDNGCVLSQSVGVVNANTIILSSTTTNSSCSLPCDGTANISVSGGSVPYSYLWSNGDNTANVTDLCSMNYSVTVSDNIGCTETEVINITSVNGMALNLSHFDTDCHIANDENINLEVSGGVPPYTYLWNTGYTNEDLIGIGTGNYSVTVIDNLGCEITGDIEVDETVPFTWDYYPLFTGSESCPGSSDGVVIGFIHSGGVWPFSYIWDDPNVQETGLLENVTSGTYCVTVADANNCVIDGCGTVNSTVNVFFDINDDGCNGVKSVTAYLQGPIFGSYLYQWDSNTGNQNTQTAIGLTSGTYSVSVTSSACTIVGTVTIPSYPGPDVTLIIDQEIDCNGDADGIISANATGGILPYSYDWNPILSSNQTITNLSADEYYVTVTDVNGDCGSASIELYEPMFPLTLTISSTDESCNIGNDGFALLYVNGGVPPYTYLWDDPLNQINYYADGLSSGTYSVTVTDANGCTNYSEITIHSEPILVASIVSTDVTTIGGSDGSVDLTVSGGNPPYTFLWSNSAITEDISGLTAGTYSVIITDASGCTHVDNVIINEPPGLSLTISETYESCPGECDGTATVIITGGTPPYTFVWNDPSAQQTGTAIDLCPGSYNVIVTDNLGMSEMIPANIITDPSVLYNPPPYLTIINGTTETWSGSGYNYTVSGYIEVLPDAQLTLQNCTLQFGANSGIIVHERGNLILDNAVLKKLDACNSLWDGVIIFGDNSLLQTSNPYDPLNPQGFVHMMNGSVVENAEIAFDIGGGGSNNPNIATAGGVLWVESNSILRNNHYCAVFQYYDKPNYSHFTDCQAIADNSVPTNGMIICFYVDGMIFNNVLFDAVQLSPAHYMAAIAGNLYNCDITNCTFNNMQRGIRYYLYNGNVSYNTFNNVERGVELYSGSFNEIYDNNFNNIPFGYYVPDVIYDAWGIYMVAPSAYNIYNNDFIGFPSADPAQFASYGTVIKGIYYGSGILFNNTYGGTDFGIQSQGINSGMKVRCNKFHTPAVNSLAVLKDYSGHGELMNQGTGCDADGKPAGNKWLDPATTPDMNIFVQDDDIAFDYYSYLFDEFGQNNTVPYNSSDNPPNLWYSNYADPNICYSLQMTPNSCDDPLQGITYDPNNNLNQFILQVNSQILANNNSIGTNNNLIDGGQKQQLLNVIHNNTPNGTLKNMLISVSPYLSDEVLLAALLEKPTPLPSGHVKEIIIANSPVTNEVMTTVNSLGLPAGILKLIQNAQHGVSSRQQLEMQTNALSGENQLIENELVNYYLKTSDFTSAKQFLAASNNLESQKKLSDILYVNKDYADCRSVVNNLALFQNSKNQYEIQNYSLLLNCLLDLAGQGKTIYELTSAQEQLIRNIASTNTQASINAQVILYSVYGDEFEHPIMKKPLQLRNQKINNKQPAIPDVQLYPNPTNGNITISCNQQIIGSLLTFEITDILGKKVFNLTFVSSEKNEIIIHDLSSGLYMYRIIDENSYKLSEDKLVIY